MLIKVKKKISFFFVPSQISSGLAGFHCIISYNHKLKHFKYKIYSFEIYKPTNLHSTCPWCTRGWWLALLQRNH